MSEAAVTAAVPRYSSANRLGNVALGIVVFLGGFVIFEPAPYELVLIGLMAAWVMAGLRINRYILPLVILLVLYLTGGLLSLTQVPNDLGKPYIYIGTTLLLAASAIFFAAIIPGDPAVRLQRIVSAYTAGAVVAAIIGILGYFAGIEFFTLYDRARGPFQDPNVFGPFLILPFVYLCYQVFTRKLADTKWHAVGAFVMLIAIVLSFSRAAWGMAAVALMMVATIAYINQRKGNGRARVIGYVILGGILLVALIAALLTLPQTSSLFAERAQLVQYYDAGEGGRFDRHAEGFMMMLEHPLGLGPFEFGKHFGEDEHNMWLKGFTVYGSLGGFAYIVLAIWTLAVSTPLLFKPRPWQAIVVCAWVVLVGHFIIHVVIDNDHWRHLFLIYGLLWGAYAAERMVQRKRPPPKPVPVYTAALARAAPA